jgi:hypothetical protein
MALPLPPLRRPRLQRKLPRPQTPTPRHPRLQRKPLRPQTPTPHHPRQQRKPLRPQPPSPWRTRLKHLRSRLRPLLKHPPRQRRQPMPRPRNRRRRQPHRSRRRQRINDHRVGAGKPHNLDSVPTCSFRPKRSRPVLWKAAQHIPLARAHLPDQSRGAVLPLGQS